LCQHNIQGTNTTVNVARDKFYYDNIERTYTFMNTLLCQLLWI